MITLGDIMRFVLDNKGTKTFIGYTNDDIMWMLNQGLCENTLLYTENKGKVSGVLLAEKREVNGVKVMFVTENLAMNISNLRKFATICKARFPDYKLEWLRRGKHHRFDTTKIYEKLKV